MSSWIKALETWMFPNGDDRPRTTTSLTDPAELLEQRLVLGSVWAAPSLAPAPAQATIVLAPQAEVEEVAAAESTVDSFAAFNSDNFIEQSESQSVESQSTVIEDDVLTSASISQNRVEQASLDFDESDQSDMPKSAREVFGPTERNQTLDDSPPVELETVLATATAPQLDAVEEPVAVSTAVDVELTEVNRQVFLTAEQIEAASAAVTPIVPAWFDANGTTAEIHYDFRDQSGVANEISAAQIERTEQILAAWSAASGGRVTFVRDTLAATDAIVNIGLGNLDAIGLDSGAGGTLGATRGQLTAVDGAQTTVGTVWLDRGELWSTTPDPAADADAVDFSTVMAHEVGHIVGLDDDVRTDGVMNPYYAGAVDLASLSTAIADPLFYMASDVDAEGAYFDQMTMGYPQLSQADVAILLARASVATPSNDAIIAIVDRNGTILGVRAEQEVLNNFPNAADLSFAIDGAVSKARTAAFFANNTAPLTSRTVRNLSQTTILQREVEANPNSANTFMQGPGFVSPVGIGGHFPADVLHTPPVDLFNIEASNRDSQIIPGRSRFNINPADIPVGKGLVTPISYGTDSGLDPGTQNRGIATLPGGVPIYRDTDGDGNGDTLIGGIGVFFPGTDGFATFEQGFVAGQDQATLQRTNADRALEAEYIAFAAVGGSQLAVQNGVSADANVGDLGGIPAIPDIDLPFGFLTLVGVGLEVFGPTPGVKGVQDLVSRFRDVSGTGADSGANQILGGAVTLRDGASVDDGFLVTPHTTAATTLTVADMNQIIDAGVEAANRVRAAIRLSPDGRTGADGVRMTFAITDTRGEVLALFRMEDSTVFSIDVAVAKARNVAYYADPGQLQAQDQVAIDSTGTLVPAGTAFSNRTFRFLAEPRFPSGVDNTEPPEFSILTDAAAAGINPRTGENIGGPASAAAFTSVMGHDVFNPGTNFHDPTDLDNQNGIIFFPGSTPLYKNGVLVGGFGVSGDGVDQDDVVTFLAAQGFLPSRLDQEVADEFNVNGVRIPFQKFNRNPFA